MEAKTVQKVITETKYVASDGKEFDTEWKCKDYEAELRIDKAMATLHKLPYVYADNPFETDGDVDSMCYYIHNMQEYRALLDVWDWKYTNEPYHSSNTELPQQNSWEFPLWVRVQGHDGWADITPATKYIEIMEQHIQSMKSDMQKALEV